MLCPISLDVNIIGHPNYAIPVCFHILIIYFHYFLHDLPQGKPKSLLHLLTHPQHFLTCLWLNPTKTVCFKLFPRCRVYTSGNMLELCLALLGHVLWIGHVHVPSISPHIIYNRISLFFSSSTSHWLPFGNLTWPLRITIYSEHSHETWWFYISMLNYQRVTRPSVGDEAFASHRPLTGPQGCGASGAGEPNAGPSPLTGNKKGPVQFELLSWGC